MKDLKLKQELEDIINTINNKICNDRLNIDMSYKTKDSYLLIETQPIVTDHDTFEFVVENRPSLKFRYTDVLSITREKTSNVLCGEFDAIRINVPESKSYFATISIFIPTEK